MLVTGEIKEFEPEMFGMMLEPCSAQVLPHILDEKVPFVFLANHLPNRYIEWRETNVQLRAGGESFAVPARSMTLDLQMPTKRFLSLLTEFADSGLSLMQFERKMPDTLQPQYLKGESRYKILKQNGLYLEFYLPHAGEYASVVTPHRAVLERIKNDPVIASGKLS